MMSSSPVVCCSRMEHHHWVERDPEFDRLNTTDDVVECEESYHKAVQHMVVDKVWLRKAWDWT